MLLAILIHCFDVNHMDMSDKKCSFVMTSLQKQSRRGNIRSQAFDQEPSLCVIRHSKAYVEKSSVFRADTDRNELLLSFQKLLNPLASTQFHVGSGMY